MKKTAIRYVLGVLLLLVAGAAVGKVYAGKVYPGWPECDPQHPELCIP